MQHPTPARVRAVQEAKRSADLVRVALTQTEMILGTELAARERKVQEKLEAATNVNRAVLGGWPCLNSPFGVCVYSDTVDPMHDDCIYCHDPEERK